MDLESDDPRRQLLQGSVLCALGKGGGRSVLSQTRLRVTSGAPLGISGFAAPRRTNASRTCDVADVLELPPGLEARCIVRAIAFETEIGEDTWIRFGWFRFERCRRLEDVKFVGSCDGRQG